MVTLAQRLESLRNEKGLTRPALSAALGMPRNAIEKFENAWGINRQEILTFRGHPLDYIPNMIANRIPVVLVCGDSDTVVPFEENGKLLLDAYKAADCPIECHMKPGGDHHPHCLPDNAPIVAFIEKYTL